LLSKLWNYKTSKRLIFLVFFEGNKTPLYEYETDYGFHGFSAKHKLKLWAGIGYFKTIFPSF
jgi:hypothetical protein